MKSLSTAFTVLLTILMLTFIACEPQTNNSAETDVAQETAQMMDEANKSVGMPNINNWYEKKLVRDLYELRDQEDLQTFTYIINMHGEKIFLGRSVGYGIPASVQYSSPKKAVDLEEYVPDNWNGIHLGKMPQPEPNGLYMPEGLSATWVMLVDDNGNPRATYVEPEILVSPVKLH